MLRKWRICPSVYIMARIASKETRGSGPVKTTEERLLDLPMIPGTTNISSFEHGLQKI